MDGLLPGVRSPSRDWRRRISPLDPQMRRLSELRSAGDRPTGHRASVPDSTVAARLRPGHDADSGLSLGPGWFGTISTDSDKRESGKKGRPPDPYGATIRGSCVIKSVEFQVSRTPEQGSSQSVQRTKWPEISVSKTKHLPPQALSGAKTFSAPRPWRPSAPAHPCGHRHPEPASERTKPDLCAAARLGILYTMRERKLMSSICNILIFM